MTETRDDIEYVLMSELQVGDMIAPWKGVTSRIKCVKRSSPGRWDIVLEEGAFLETLPDEAMLPRVKPPAVKIWRVWGHIKTSYEQNVTAPTEGEAIAIIRADVRAQYGSHATFHPVTTQDVS